MRADMLLQQMMDEEILAHQTTELETLAQVQQVIRYPMLIDQEFDAFDWDEMKLGMQEHEELASILVEMGGGEPGYEARYGGGHAQR